MKFSEMTYVRPDLDALKKEIAETTERLKNAFSYDEARMAFLSWETTHKHMDSLQQIVMIRHMQDVTDAFYAGEAEFWEAAEPELNAAYDEWTKAMSRTRFKGQFKADYGNVMFLNAALKQRAFDKRISSEISEENRLIARYQAVMNEKIPFREGSYPQTGMQKFKGDSDDALRIDAWRTEGEFYAARRDTLDEIFDALVTVRTEMGKKTGTDSFLQIGYDRMLRNSYGEEEVTRFRESVIRHIVPLAEEVSKLQAERIGKPYPLRFEDDEVMFRSGNPSFKIDFQTRKREAVRFFRSLSKETAEFYSTMIENDMMDIEPREHKANGGFVALILDYAVPFIYANRTGTHKDFESITKEAGSAFVAYLNRERLPESAIWPSADAAEVHALAMEFFAEPMAKVFFGEDIEKFRYTQIARILKNMPYYCMADHFQHEVYKHPSLSHDGRHALWKELSHAYRPWLSFDSEVPYYRDGCGWQRQRHIYAYPLYMIDYALGQAVALQFAAEIRTDRAAAWQKYIDFSSRGGSLVFTDLVEKAGLQSPFEDAVIEGIAGNIREYLATYSLEDIV